jgi:hypothetical protein
MKEEAYIYLYIFISVVCVCACMINKPTTSPMSDKYATLAHLRSNTKGREIK